MYLSFFGLTQSPFGITPNPAFFFAGNTRGAILEAMIYAVSHGEGIIKVTGEVGSGKTMLCRMLESMLPENVVAIYLVNPTLSREEVVYTIAGELNLQTSGKRPDEVIRILQADLIGKHIEGKQVVLLVEEAQAMPLETLEEIRLFSNLETAHNKLLQIVMFGQPELDENLALPHMRQLKERITHSFKVPAMPADVIPDFLMFRMQAAGYHGPDIFTQGAISQLSKVSGGIVRRINILADKALLAAFAENTHTIRARHVKSAIQDSEFATAKTHWWEGKATLLLAGFSAACLLATAGLIAWNFYGPLPKPALIAAAPAPLPAGNLIATPAAMPAPAASVTPAAAQVAPQEAASQPAPMPPSPATSSPPAASPVLVASVAVAPAAASVPATTTTPPAKLVATTPAGPTNPAAATAAPGAKPLHAGLLDQQLAASKAWLEGESPDHYTVQISLLTAERRAEVDAFLKKIATDFAPLEIHLFPNRAKNIDRFGVVVGAYATRADATAAQLKMAEALGYRPQLRTIAGIRKEIDSSDAASLWQAH